MFNSVRLRRQKQMAKYEIEKDCYRYNYECGKCHTRKATPEEMNKTGRRYKFLKKEVVD